MAYRRAWEPGPRRDVLPVEPWPVTWARAACAGTLVFAAAVAAGFAMGAMVATDGGRRAHAGFGRVALPARDAEGSATGRVASPGAAEAMDAGMCLEGAGPRDSCGEREAF